MALLGELAPNGALNVAGPRESGAPWSLRKGP